MKHTYKITQVVEMSITRKVRAVSADEANDIFQERAHRACQVIERAHGVNFGDMSDDYLPARDKESPQ